MIPEKEVNQAVVSVRTSTWSDSNGIYRTKSIKYLKRKSKGFNFVDEDIRQTGEDLVFDNIININEVKDGHYLLVMCNFFEDRETGHIEDWDYKLIPYKDEKKAATKV